MRRRQRGAIRVVTAAGTATALVVLMGRPSGAEMKTCETERCTEVDNMQVPVDLVGDYLRGEWFVGGQNCCW
jgi:hypothetical protein